MPPKKSKPKAKAPVPGSVEKPKVVQPVKKTVSAFDRQAAELGQTPAVFALKVLLNPTRWQEFYHDAKKIRTEIEQKGS